MDSPVQKTEITAVGILRADHATPLYLQKFALASPTSGGRSVVIGRSRTKATEFSFFMDSIHVKEYHIYITCTFIYGYGYFDTDKPRSSASEKVEKKLIISRI
jgi:hypothetical protein